MTSRRLEAAERAVIDELYPELRRFAAVAGPLDVDPDELLAEAITRTVRHHRITADEDPTDRIRRAVLHAASAHRHRLGRERRAMARLHVTAGGVEPISTDAAELLRVSPTVRSLLFLVDVEGIAPADVGRSIGTTADAVVSTTERARATLAERLGGDESVRRALERLATRGPVPDPQTLVHAAERRMRAVSRPPPPPRPRMKTEGWERRRRDLDRNARAFGAGVAVAVFLVAGAVVAALLFSMGGDDSAASVTTVAENRGTATTVAPAPSNGRIVGWEAIGELPDDVIAVVPTTTGFVASDPEAVRWSPDGADWVTVSGPNPGAAVATDGRDVVALDPPTLDNPAGLWRSDDGGRTWEAVPASAALIPRIEGVAITVERFQVATTFDTVIAAATVRGSLDWATLLDVAEERISTGSIDDQRIIWVEAEDGSARVAHRLDAIRSGSQIRLIGVRVDDGEQVFQLDGSAGLLTTTTASSALVDGGELGTAVWRSHDAGRFERTEAFPADDGRVVGGSRITVVSAGSAVAEPSIWDSETGESWEPVEAGLVFEGERLMGVLRRDSDWAAVTATADGVSFWASIDGRHWFRSETGEMESPISATMSSSASGWIAAITAADGTSVYWSPNGVEWAIQIVPNRDLHAVTSGRGGVIAVDDEGAVYLGAIGT